MNNTYYQALSTYTSRLTLVLVALVGLLLLIGMLFVAEPSSGNDPGRLAVAAQFVALPVMLGVLLITQQGKYQFVHPRARLVPGFATPHLTILIGLLALLTIACPWFASTRLGYSPLGMVAFSSLFAALIAWQVQSLRSWLMLLAMAMYFSFFHPTAAQLWIGTESGWTGYRLAILAAGWLGIVLWLVRLTRMNDGDNDYLVPVQQGFGNTSRMEKSESRQLLAAWVARSPLHRWGVDMWHDRLATVTTPPESVRPRLLNYGMWALPLPVASLQFLMLAASIVCVQLIVLTGMSQGDGSRSVEFATTMWSQFGFFCLLVPLLSCHLLATRRNRLAQDLMLPLTREALVDGLRRNLIAINLWALVPAAVVVLVGIWQFVPERLTALNVASAALVGVAVQPVMLATAMRLALVRSGIARFAADDAGDLRTRWRGNGTVSVVPLRDVCRRRRRMCRCACPWYLGRPCRAALLARSRTRLNTLVP